MFATTLFIHIESMAFCLAILDCYARSMKLGSLTAVIGFAHTTSASKGHEIAKDGDEPESKNHLLYKPFPSLHAHMLANKQSCLDAPLHVAKDVGWYSTVALQWTPWIADAARSQTRLIHPNLQTLCRSATKQSRQRVSAVLGVTFNRALAELEDERQSVGVLPMTEGRCHHQSPRSGLMTDLPSPFSMQLTP